MLCARLAFWNVSVRPKFGGRTISVKRAKAEMGVEGRMVTLWARMPEIGAAGHIRCVHGPAAITASVAGRVIVSKVDLSV